MINIAKISTKNKEMKIISEEITIKLGKVGKSMILHLSAIGKCFVTNFGPKFWISRWVALGPLVNKTNLSMEYLWEIYGKSMGITYGKAWVSSVSYTHLTLPTIYSV